MTLDLVTLYVVSIVVISVGTTAFVLEVTSRGRSPVDLVWTLAFTAAIGTALCYLVAGWSDSLWWFNALGNAASVVTTFAMWNGIRAGEGRRPLLGVTAAVAVFTALVALLPGPDGGAWAGGWAALLGTATGAALGSVVGLRGRLRHHRLGGLLSWVLLVVALYYGLRSVIFLTAGPESPIFRSYVGTAPTTLVVLVLVTVAGYAAVAARADEVRVQGVEHHRFDPTTGLRTSATFVPRVVEALRDAATGGRPVALVSVTVEGTEHLATAFHPQTADVARALVVDIARAVAPPAALAGRESDEQDTFDVLLPGLTGAQAHSWAEMLRRRVIATPLDTEVARLRLRVSAGVTTDAECGYDLAALRATARGRVDKALTEGGNRVLSWF